MKLNQVKRFAYNNIRHKNKEWRIDYYTYDVFCLQL